MTRVCSPCAIISSESLATIENEYLLPLSSLIRASITITAPTLDGALCFIVTKVPTEVSPSFSKSFIISLQQFSIYAIKLGEDRTAKSPDPTCSAVSSSVTV